MVYWAKNKMFVYCRQ